MADKSYKSPEYHKYITLLNELERHLTTAGIEHRWVGGTIVNFIPPNIVRLPGLVDIDPYQRRILFEEHLYPTFIRPRDNTVVDIDAVCFSPNQSRVAKAITKANIIVSRCDPKPQLSIETANHPGSPERNRFVQLVTVFEIDENNVPHLVFGDHIDYPISPESLAPWTYVFGDDVSLTSLHPWVLRQCYDIRVPSGPKRKDKGEKLNPLKQVADMTIEAGRRTVLDYEQEFQGWSDYADHLLHHPDPLTRTKGLLLRPYWGTPLGEWVSHGRFPFGYAVRFSNRFTGSHPLAEVDNR